MGSVRFQQLLAPAYTSGCLQAPSGVVGVTYRDFNLLHSPFWSGSLCLFGFCSRSLQCLVSALTQAGGGGLLFGSLVPSRCGEGRHCFPRLRCSGSRLLCMEPAVPALGCSTKVRTRLHLRFVPSPSERLRQPGADGRALPGCTAPSPLRGPSPSPRPSGSGSQELTGALSPGAPRLLPSAAPAPVPARAGRVRAPCVSPRPSRRMSTIQNLRRSLIGDWRPVCSAVGAAVLGPSPPLSPPPASCLRRGWAGPQPASSSGLARSLCSANGRQCVPAG